MHSFSRILALTAVALLLAAGGAWACCGNGLVECCDMESHSGSEHCPDTQTMSMDCSVGHAFTPATGTVIVKTTDPSLTTQTLAALGRSTQDADRRTRRTLFAGVGVGPTDPFKLLAVLRL